MPNIISTPTCFVTYNTTILDSKPVRSQQIDPVFSHKTVSFRENSPIGATTTAAGWRRLLLAGCCCCSAELLLLLCRGLLLLCSGTRLRRGAAAGQHFQFGWARCGAILWIACGGKYLEIDKFIERKHSVTDHASYYCVGEALCWQDHIC